MSVAADIATVIGVACLAYAAWLIHPAAMWAVVGLACVSYAVAHQVRVEADRRRKRK